MLFLILCFASLYIVLYLRMYLFFLRYLCFTYYFILFCLTATILYQIFKLWIFNHTEILMYWTPSAFHLHTPSVMQCICNTWADEQSMPGWKYVETVACWHFVAKLFTFAACLDRGVAHKLDRPLKTKNTILRASSSQPDT